MIQANLQLPDRFDYPGYSFSQIDGEATHAVISNEVMTQDCPPTWEGGTWSEGSLVESLSCVIGVFNANYCLQEGSYNRVMEVRPQGRTLILSGTGLMGLLAIDYVLHGPINPSLLIVTDTNKPRLSYARRHYPSELQTLIHYLDDHEANRDTLLALNGGHGSDDVFVSALNEQLIILASSLLAPDGYLNFFAGPQNKRFSAPINFYDVRCAFTHYVDTSGGSTDDIRVTMVLIQAKKVQTVKVVTHILSPNVASETILGLPAASGERRLVCTGKAFPLTSLGEITDLELTVIMARHHGAQSQEAEAYLPAHAKDTTYDQPRYAAVHLPGESPWQPRHPLS